MSEPFDPYYKWLAIPPKDQPPNFYRLLAIELFESDSDVIANAADQRMSHLKAYQTSQYGTLSQQLLNEMASARTTLLNPEKKQQYDAGLRVALAAGPPQRPSSAGAKPPGPRSKAGAAAKIESVEMLQPVTPRVELVDVTVEGASARLNRAKRPGRSGQPAAQEATAIVTNHAVNSKLPAASSKKPHHHEMKIRVIGHIVAPLVGLLLGYFILTWIRPDFSLFGSSDNGANENGRSVAENDQPGTDDVPGTAHKSPTDDDPRDVPGSDTGGSIGPRKDPHVQQPPPQENGGERSPFDDDPLTDTTDANSSGAGDASDGSTRGTGDGPLDAATTDATGGVDPGDQTTGGPTSDVTEPTPEEVLAQLERQRDGALARGNLPEALQATTLIAGMKDQDAMQAQADLLAEVAKTAKDPDDFKRVAEGGLNLIDKAVAAGRADIARRLANQTLLAARKADDVSLVRKATQRVIAVQDLQEN